MPALVFDETNEDDVAAAQEVFQAWQDGSQEVAIERLRLLANEGRPWALSFITWLYAQRGGQEMARGIPYAKKAAELGMHWVSVHLFNSLIGNGDLSPGSLLEAEDLVIGPGTWWTGIDPAGQGWNLIARGQAQQAVRIMGLRSPFPTTKTEWESLAESAREQLTEITDVLDSARETEERVGTAAAAHLEAMEKVRKDLETSAKQADLLVTTVTSEGTEARFQADADRNKKESKAAWGWGLVVLAAAASVAVAPLAMHYVGLGPDYSTGALLGAHAGSTAALAAVAGVLLARARSRDLARQRASDLSTAIATMITYSSQISDPDERQRFMTTMGQLVLQAHLTTGPQGHQTDESLTGLIALANVMKPGSPSSGS